MNYLCMQQSIWWQFSISTVFISDVKVIYTRALFLHHSILHLRGAPPPHFPSIDASISLCWAVAISLSRTLIIFALKKLVTIG